MKAAIFQKAGEPMVVRTVPMPTIGQDELLVKIVAASLCGSDLIPYKGHLGPKTEGLIGGHEAVGIVVAVHDSTNKFIVGDRVGFLNCLSTCGNCTSCLAGQPQFCENGKRNQGFDASGFLAEYAVVKSQFAVHIPDNLPIERLSPLFCAGVTAFRAVKQVRLPQRGTIGVFGLGGVGIFAVRFAKAMGFEVIGFDISQAALASAKKSGAIEAVNSSDEEKVKATIKRHTNGEGLGGSLVTTGVQAAFSSAIAHTAFNGTIVAVGVPRSAIEVDIFTFIKKGLRLQGTQSGTPLELKEMMKLVEAHSIIPEIELFDLEHVPEMIKILESGQAGGKMGIVFQ